jgi:hypothetical protein
LTCNCIESIYKHTTGISFEIILVDNGSRECDPGLFINRFPNIILVRSTVNTGFSGGNNLGLTYAKGKFILLLNSDVIFVENSLFKCYNRIGEDENIGVLSCQLRHENGNIQQSANGFPSISNELIELFRLNKIFKSLNKRLGGFYFNHAESIEVDWVWGTFFLLRTEVLDKFPNRKLPDKYFMYYEDVDWCYLISRKLGYKILFYADTYVIHLLSASSSNEKVASKKKLLLKHESMFLQQYTSSFTSRLYFLIKGIKFLTIRTRESLEMSLDCLKYFLKGAA